MRGHKSITVYNGFYMLQIVGWIYSRKLAASPFYGYVEHSEEQVKLTKHAISEHTVKHKWKTFHDRLLCENNSWFICANH